MASQLPVCHVCHCNALGEGGGDPLKTSHAKHSPHGHVMQLDTPLRYCCSRQCRQFPGSPRISAGRAAAGSPPHGAPPAPPRTLRAMGGCGRNVNSQLLSRPKPSSVLPCCLPTAFPSHGLLRSALRQDSAPSLRLASGPSLLPETPAPYLGAAASAAGGGSLPDGGVSSAGVGSLGGSDSAPSIGSRSVGLVDGASSDPAAAWLLLWP